MQYEDFKHGHKCYRTIAGVRHLVALRPTIRPYDAESTFDFETRMQRLAEILSADPGVENVDVWHKHIDTHVIVECELDIRLVPEPQPILDLGTVTSRRAEPRGQRGSGRMREVARA